ncbi:MAG: 3-methyl-2-oxobutanoate hydroxymethyltransferase [Gammaproteobacteria bacterium]
MSTPSNKKSITLSSLNRYKENSEKFTCLTAYESTLASVISESGVDVILVGDSLGMVIQGHDSTLPVTMDQLVYHLECVVNGNKGSHIMADMPFMSYSTDDLGLENAKRLMQAGANSIKIEGGEWISKMAQVLSDRGIPVCAHMGLTPQTINRIGGHNVQGRDPSQKEKIINEAKTLEKAGASMLLLECVPGDLAKVITDELKIPVIGIGAGIHTDGQIMVIHDLLGISCLDKLPKFVKNFMEESSSIQEAIKKYVSDVKGLKFPSDEHTFK